MGGHTQKGARDRFVNLGNARALPTGGGARQHHTYHTSSTQVYSNAHARARYDKRKRTLNESKIGMEWKSMFSIIRSWCTL